MLSARQVWPRDKSVPPATGQAGILQNCAPRVSSRPHAPVAQLDRVPDYESGGRTFESCQARHTNKGPRGSGAFLFVLCALAVRMCSLDKLCSMQSLDARAQRRRPEGGSTREATALRSIVPGAPYKQRASRKRGLFVCPVCFGRENVFVLLTPNSRSGEYGKLRSPFSL